MQSVMQTRLTLQELLLRIEYLQSLLVHGGTWTAEAREPNRRQKLHEQLCLARKLRAILEQAADKAEKLSPREARTLLLQHTADISTLACLTEAVRGNYTLNSYDYYTQRAQQTQQARQQDVDRAKSVLDVHLDTMAQEEAPSEAEETATKHDADSGRKEAAKKPKAKTSKIAKKAKAQQHSFKLPKHTLLGGRPRTARAVASKPPDYGPYDEEAPDVVQMKRITTKRGRRQRETSQCHDCKSSTTFFARCSYWNADGTMCKKTYCRKCLESKYHLPRDDWETAAGEQESDWQ